MKKRIHLLLLSLILVFSIFPACGVSAKELYDFQIGFTNKAGSTKNSQSENTGSDGVSSPRWVLVNTSYDVVDDKHYGGTNVAYSFEGDSDGTVRFKRSGGIYKDARNYYRSDVYYECMKPPATLTPGQPITLTLKTTVENYEHASTDGTKPGVHVTVPGYRMLHILKTSRTIIIPISLFLSRGIPMSRENSPVPPPPGM